MNTNLGTNSLLVLLTTFVATAAQLKITSQPKDQTLSVFADASFSALASGDPPLAYQWRFNGIALPGMTTSNLTITNVQRSSLGDYDLTVSNLSGSVTSQVATLTIVPLNSMYFFGFSWTGPNNCRWDPPSFWGGRPSNGPLWPEYVSTNLGLAYAPGNNFAWCGAGAIGILDQVSHFPLPPKPMLSGYFVWIGSDWDGNDATAEPTLRTDIQNTIEAARVLYQRGARTIVFTTHQDDSKLPEWSTWTNLTSYELQLNIAASNAIAAFADSAADARIIWVDAFQKLNQVVGHPAAFGFTRSDIAVLDDTNLTNKSFDGPGADYVFWHEAHGTTKLHRLMSTWHLAALTNSVLEKLEPRPAGKMLVIQMRHLQIGRDYALQNSDDLVKWVDLHAFTAASGTNVWSGETQDTFVSSYFRLKWQK